MDEAFAQQLVGLLPAAGPDEDIDEPGARVDVGGGPREDVAVAALREGEALVGSIRAREADGRLLVRGISREDGEVESSRTWSVQGAGSSIRAATPQPSSDRRGERKAAVVGSDGVEPESTARV